MRALIMLLRPHQWLKNLMLLFPPFLGGQLLLTSQSSLIALLIPVLSFCLASSCIYILNDLCDLEQDRRHPRKRLRPLASGQINKQVAFVLLFFLGVSALSLGWAVSGHFALLVAGYLVLCSFYSFWGKTVAVLELFLIVAGFILRLAAGGVAYGVIVSDWLFLSVFFLALYLAAGKRLSEQRHDGGVAPGAIRPVLEQYPQGFIEGVMLVSGATVLVTYTFYVVDHQQSIWVIPLCCFGLFSFYRRVLLGRGGDPTRALLKEPMLFLTGLAWATFVAWGLYGG